MARRVGEIEVYASLEDRDLIAGLARIDNDFERTKRKLEREKIDIDLGVRRDKLKKDLERAEKDIKDAEDRLDKATNDRARKRIKLELDGARKIADARRKEIAGIEGAVKSRKAENAEIERTDKLTAAALKREEAREKLIARAESRKAAAARRQERDNARIARQEEMAEQRRNREIAAIPKMTRQYAELANKIERLQDARRKARGNQRAEMLVDLKIAESVAEMKALKATLERVGSPIDLEVNLNPGRRAGERLRHSIMGALGRSHSLTAVAAMVGADIGSHMGRSAVTRFNATVNRGIGGNLRSLGAATGGVLARGLSKIGHTLGGLSEMTVRLGPFTATIRQVVVAMSLFAPIILDIVGALGSLVSLVGSATLGLGALSAGVLGGALPAMLGMGLVIKDVVQEFQAVKKAQKAYNDALMKGNEELADKKLKELKATLGNVSETTAKQVASAQKLGRAWDKATKPAHAAVWTAVGKAIKTGRVLMDEFAAQTNTGMQTAEKATSRWMKALRSDEGQGALRDMMTNFNASLGPLLNGLGNLAAYIGRVGRIASFAFPGMAKDFEDWTDKVNKGGEDMGVLGDKVDNAIESLRALGRFTMSSGRLLKAFFGAGVGAGQNFADVMSRAMDGWTRQLNTAQGQANMRQFFNEAVSGARAFYNTLAPIISSFVRWAANIAPFARAFFEGASAVSGFVNEILKLTGLRGPLTALVTTLGVLWGIGKIRAATTAVAGFTRALLGLKAAQTGMATAGALGSVASALPARAVPAAIPRAPGLVGVGPLTQTAKAAEKAAGATSRLAKVGSLASRGLSGLGAAALGMANPVAGVAIVTAVAGAALYKFATRTRDYTHSMQAAEEETKNHLLLSQQIPAASDQVAQAYLDENAAALNLKAAQKEVNRLRKEGKLRTDEGRMALQNLSQAQLDEHRVSQARRDALESENKLLVDNTRAAEKAYAARKKQVEQRGGGGVKEQYQEVKEQAELAGMGVQEFIKALSKQHPLLAKELDGVREYADALGAEERAAQRVRDAHAQAYLAHLNQDRALKGLIPISLKAANAFMKLARAGAKNIAQKISVKFTDPGEAAQTARAAGNALRNGVPKSVISRIVADSSDAEEAIRRLQRAKITPKKLDIIEHGGREAVRVLENIIGKKLTTKQQNIVEKGGAQAMGVLRNILGTKLLNKVFDIIARDNATQVINRLRGARLAPIYQDIYVRQHKSGAPVRPLSGPARATGGLNDNTGAPASVADAARAQRSPVMRALGAMVRKPTAIVGEETGNSREYIIATNPAYRKRNRALLARAASDLGGMAAFAKGGVNYGGSFKGAEFHPNARLKPPGYLKHRAKTKRQKLRAERGWAKHVESLKTQQSNWEREVQIREGRVQEPADWIVQIGEDSVTDPTTGEVTKIPKYGPNQAAINDYTKNLDAVLTAMKTLLSVVSALVSAIPQAIAANKAERDYRHDRVTKLNGWIKDENAKKTPNKDNIEKWKKERDGHQQEIGTLDGDRKTLIQDRVDAGFDFREYTDARQRYQDDYDDATGVRGPARGQREADQANADAQPTPSTGGSGGTGGSDSTTFQTETGNVLALAKSELTKSFGSNIVDATQSATAAVAGAITGGRPLRPGTHFGALRIQSSRANMAMLGARQSPFSSQAINGFLGSNYMPPGGVFLGSQQPLGAASAGATIINNFAAPPPDSYTFSRQLAWDVRTAF